MKIPFLSRLLEIKEKQLRMEAKRTNTIIDILRELRYWRMNLPANRKETLRMIKEDYKRKQKKSLNNHLKSTKKIQNEINKT